MKNVFFFLAMAVAAVTTAQNPFMPSEETLTAMEKISFLTGVWTGEGWVQMGPQKHTFSQTENIVSKVNGTVIQIDGLGRDIGNPERVIHQAFAVISYDTEQQKYLMKAFRADGAQIDGVTRLVNDHTFQWGFSNPVVGEIKFTISVQNNTWTETGEMSRDGGKTWLKYLEMILKRE